MEKMLFFNYFRSWLRIGFRNHAASWKEVFVTKIGGFQLMVIVTKDLVLDAAEVLYPLLFTQIC